jgi:hypothetical protein
MTNSVINVLLVGTDFHARARDFIERLRRRGFRCHFADTRRAAFEFLKSHDADVVLSQMRLSDGSGFGMVAALTGLPVSAFLCLPIGDSCFWLPAMDQGRNCWGPEKLTPADLLRALETLGCRMHDGPLVMPPLFHAEAA